MAILKGSLKGFSWVQMKQGRRGRVERKGKKEYVKDKKELFKIKEEIGVQKLRKKEFMKEKKRRKCLKKERITV